MPFELIDLSAETASLEFDVDDIDHLGSVIKGHYPELKGKRRSFYTEYYFGGCEFTYVNEWDDPCMLSHCIEGTRILRKLCRILSGS